MKKLLFNETFRLGVLIGMLIGTISAWFEFSYNNSKAVETPRDTIVISEPEPMTEGLSTKQEETLERIIQEMITKSKATGQEFEIVVGDYLNK